MPLIPAKINKRIGERVTEVDLHALRRQQYAEIDSGGAGLGRNFAVNDKILIARPTHYNDDPINLIEVCQLVEHALTHVAESTADNEPEDTDSYRIGGPS